MVLSARRLDEVAADKAASRLRDEQDSRSSHSSHNAPDGTCARARALTQSGEESHNNNNNKYLIHILN